MDTAGNPVQYTGIGDPTPSAAFDEDDDFAISWTQDRDSDNIPSRNLTGSAASAGVYFREYALSGAILRSPDKRANSGLRPNTTGAAQMIGLNPDAYKAIWPWSQYNGQVVMDADGDLTVSYEGFGPDVAQTGYEGAGITLVNQMLNQPQNADLKTLWNNVGGFPQPNDGFNSGDPDSMIEEVLIRAQYLGSTDDQLGRLGRHHEPGPDARPRRSQRRHVCAVRRRSDSRAAEPDGKRQRRQQPARRDQPANPDHDHEEHHLGQLHDSAYQ